MNVPRWYGSQAKCGEDRCRRLKLPEAGGRVKYHKPIKPTQIQPVILGTLDDCSPIEHAVRVEFNTLSANGSGQVESPAQSQQIRSLAKPGSEPCFRTRWREASEV